MFNADAHMNVMSIYPVCLLVSHPNDGSKHSLRDSYLTLLESAFLQTLPANYFLLSYFTLLSLPPFLLLYDSGIELVLEETRSQGLHLYQVKHPVGAFRYLLSFV